MMQLRQVASRPVTLFVTTRVKPGCEAEYKEVDDQLVELAHYQPGFLGDYVVPVEGEDAGIWTTIIRFSSREYLDDWVNNEQRHAFLDKLQPFIIGQPRINVFASKDSEPLFSEGVVSLIWYFDVPTTSIADFKNYALDIGQEAVRFSGFLGIDVQQPDKIEDVRWAVITRWKSEDDCREWEKSKRCQRVIAQCRHIAKFERLGTVPSTLSSWLTFNDPTEGRSEPTWKMSMLTLLMLYPTVFFLSIYISRQLNNAVAGWLSMFIGNLLSVIILSWVLIPAARFVFKGFLNPTPYRRKIATRIGVVVLILLYITEMAIFALVWFPIPTWLTS